MYYVEQGFSNFSLEGPDKIPSETRKGQNIGQYQYYNIYKYTNTTNTAESRGPDWQAPWAGLWAQGIIIIYMQAVPEDWSVYTWGVSEDVAEVFSSIQCVDPIHTGVRRTGVTGITLAWVHHPAVSKLSARSCLERVERGQVHKG